MKKNGFEYITTNKLQANISKIIKEVENGAKYQVMRYSQPIAVLISRDYYDQISEELIELKTACNSCIQALRKSKGVKR